MPTIAITHSLQLMDRKIIKVIKNIGKVIILDIFKNAEKLRQKAASKIWLKTLSCR